MRDSSWILDSGASSHMTNDRINYIGGMKRFADPRPVLVDNGNSMKALGTGTVQLGKLTLPSVWYVPDVNLLSVNAL